MAFNGDGPHSKRQRLEESGHRVSTRQLIFRRSCVSPCLAILATAFPSLSPPLRCPPTLYSLVDVHPVRFVLSAAGGRVAARLAALALFTRGGASPFIGVMIGGRESARATRGRVARCEHATSSRSAMRPAGRHLSAISRR